MNKRLIVIGGPTASGKTSLAIKIAKYFSTQILSADSRQCYKELNIGVAKPSDEELAAIPHHFISSHTIHEEVTAGMYERYGLACLENIFKKSDIAVCVGGTGLYIKALCEGLDVMPQINNTIKSQIENEYKQKGLKWLQIEMQKNDPLLYKQLDINNPMRLLRALIFYKSHNVSISAFQTTSAAQRNFDINYYSIQIDRGVLYNNINQRVATMMDNGLLQEVKELLAYQDIKALQTVGYKELFAYYNNEISEQKAIDKIMQHTRNYAKRQITWFKNQGIFNILPAEAIFDKIRE